MPRRSRTPSPRVPLREEGAYCLERLDESYARPPRRLRVKDRPVRFVVVDQILAHLRRRLDAAGEGGLQKRADRVSDLQHPEVRRERMNPEVILHELAELLLDDLHLGNPRAFLVLGAHGVAPASRLSSLRSLSRKRRKTDAA